MGLIEQSQLIKSLSPPIELSLSTKLVNEFVSMERRFIQRDWEPTELDGGQFAEIAARILYHLDSGTLNLSKGHDDCLKYFTNDTVIHNLDRKEVSHIAKILQAIYKFRSQRGAVHISHTYTPNHMDSKFLMESVRWCMNEFLRIFWNTDRDSVAKAIKELLQFDVPCIGVYGNKILIQRTDLRPDEEILVLLHFAGLDGFSRTVIGKSCMLSPSSITTNLQKLISPSCRQIIQLTDGNYTLTDLGHKRIRENLVDKLLLQ